jgi:putative flippase GtrA
VTRARDPDASAASPAGRGHIAAQIPSFALVGLVGYVIDAGLTYGGAKYLGLAPEVARLPGFVVATIVNFLLNRAITFRHSPAPILRAFVRYVAVASAGLVVNYAVYSAGVLLAPRFGLEATPATLPLFIAAGVGAAMAFTFLGFRFFAFRP